MENQKYAKIFKICLWALLILSVIVLVGGSLAGFEANDGAATDWLLRWTYFVLFIALVAVVGVGIVIRATTEPKSLVKIGIAVLGAAVLFGIAYLLAAGSPAVGYSGAKLPSASELKLTDTILNITYIVGSAAILSIVVGEILMFVRNKK